MLEAVAWRFIYLIIRNRYSTMQGGGSVEAACGAIAEITMKRGEIGLV